jgi:hypothetical protein
MSLRVTSHSFTGATTSIASYDSTKTNLGTLMIQKSGVNPEDNFVGPLPVAVARPFEESIATASVFPHVLTYSSTIDWVFLLENTSAAAKRVIFYEYNKVLGSYNWKGFIVATTPNATATNRGFRALRYLHTTGTVAVAGPVSVYATGTAALTITGVVTGTGTTFAITHVGMMIGFGSTNVAQINCWYPIVAFTNTTAITVLGASSAIAASAFVIASCTVTGTSTNFVGELIAAGTNVTGVIGGLGPRIGFGSTDPTQITNWYHIGSIASNTSLNLSSSPGVIEAGTPYVIEELRFVITTNNSTAANGGLFLLKGAGYYDFTTTGTTFPSIASAVDNQRGVYWLCDAGAGAVTNTSPAGCAVEAETSKTSHFAYVLDGIGASSAKIYKYNLRANNTVAAGKMQLAGANIVITGSQALTGTIPNPTTNISNNGIIATPLHGPQSGIPCFYFVTTSRICCVPVSGIVGASTTFIPAASLRQEVPPGGAVTFSPTVLLTNIAYLSSIDRFLVTTFFATSAFRNYITKHSDFDGFPYEHIFTIDDKQTDQSIASSNAAIHFSSNLQTLTADENNGILHISKAGVIGSSSQMYALPVACHWTYAYTTTPSNHQRIITPSMNTTGCLKFDQVVVVSDNSLGVGSLAFSTETYRVYYRTSDIVSDATSSWVLLGEDGDLSSVAPANAIQFMFEFFIIGTTCAPARILEVLVTYEDDSTDSHYQLSASLSSATNERFVWRFYQNFGKTVPNLKVEFFNATTGVSIISDTTTLSANGTWEKSINGGTSWITYNTTDKTNDDTYIRYTPTNPLGNVIVKALLTQI